MKVNAAELIARLLGQSDAATGYSIRLDLLKLHSMVVDHDSLVVDTDANVTVR
jgi:hypothetical protein